MQQITDTQGRVLLTIRQVDPAPQIERQGSTTIWRGVRKIQIELGDDHWYGQGGLGHQLYPLEKMAQYAAPFVTSDNGATGLLGTLEPFWFTHRGAAVGVNSTSEITTSFNAPLSGEPPLHSFTTPAPLHLRPQLAESTPTDGLLTITGENLEIAFFTGKDAREVIEVYYQSGTLPEPPPAVYFEKPLWTTWAYFKNDISHDKIIDFARKIQHYGFECGTLGIDAKWQAQFGDTEFDPVKFPSPQQTVDLLHEMGIKMTLWCVPFFNQESQHFQSAIDQDYVIKKVDGTPYIGDWWEGRAAFLDVTKPAALEWHLDNLQRLAQKYGIDGFKFDAGEGMFYDIPGTVLAGGNADPNAANTAYISAIARRYPWSDMRSAWRTQDQPMLYRQWDKSSVWGYDNGLASCITQAITFNLIGYPYSFPDMIGGNKYGAQVITAELMIRWTQAVALMPIIQFSVAPWDYGDECAEICARYARLHQELAPRSMAIHHAPIVRPLWWLAPTDENALTCADEYLIGDDLLVAPVIIEGARNRDIYLPPGTWRSYWDHNEVHQGAAWLKDYPAPLDVLPLFERI